MKAKQRLLPLPLLAIFTVWLPLSSCEGQHPAASHHTLTDMKLPYKFDAPDKVFWLPPELVEISGLSLFEEERYLIAVQDEWGHFFKIDRQTGEVLPSIPFGTDGDYEGIEFVGEHLYIVNSSGTLFRLTQPGSPQQEVKAFENFLNESYDVEGLGYDRESHSLLLVCKEHPHGKEDRMIYAFDLNTHRLGKKPVFQIQQDSIRSLSTEKIKTFKPSGIARHPHTKDYYILSAAADMLLVMNSEGSITHLVSLPKKQHYQPEGICFASDGTLYISDEGSKILPASIKVFSPSD